MRSPSRLYLRGGGKGSASGVMGGGVWLRGRGVVAHLTWVRALSWPERRMGLMMAVCCGFWSLEIWGCRGIAEWWGGGGRGLRVVWNGDGDLRGSKFLAALCVPLVSSCKPKTHRGAHPATAPLKGCCRFERPWCGWAAFKPHAQLCFPRFPTLDCGTHCWDLVGTRWG